MINSGYLLGAPPPKKKTQKKNPKQNKEVRKRKISCYPKS